MKNMIKIPVAMQIRVDDVGWHNGSDDRFMNRPSRTGMPRKHHVLDYPVLNEIGKALDMKICASLVIGEWDKDNILRGEPHVTYDVDGWDRASEIDMKYATEAFELLESSEYITYTMHGILHGYYDNGVLITEKQYNPYEYDAERGIYIEGKHTWMPSSELERHIELFFKIYDSWGFKKEVKAFACPCGCWGKPEDEGNVMYAEILKKYGLNVWENGWGLLKDKSSAVTNGVVCLAASAGDPVEWNAYDVDPDYMELLNKGDREHPYPDHCTHWVNWLRWNPEKNMEYLPKWIAYFKKQAEIFGVMLSKDIEFAGSQAVYSRYSKLDLTEDKCIIDLSEVDNKDAIVLKKEFYISFKNDVVPLNITGGRISVYETQKEFKTYKIVRDGSKKVEIMYVVTSKI